MANIIHSSGGGSSGGKVGDVIDIASYIQYTYVTTKRVKIRLPTGYAPKNLIGAAANNSCDVFENNPELHMWVTLYENGGKAITIASITSKPAIDRCVVNITDKTYEELYFWEFDSTVQGLGSCVRHLFYQLDGTEPPLPALT